MNREKAIKILSSYKNSYFGDALHGGVISVSEIIELLSAQSENDWIPVTKKAHPDFPIRVQVQLRNGWIITAYWDEGNWFSVPCWGRIEDHTDDDEYYKVEAWRELPEPYKERREE